MTFDELCEAFDKESARVTALSPVERELYYKSFAQSMRDINAKHDKMDRERRVTTEVMNRVCNL